MPTGTQAGAGVAVGAAVVAYITHDGGWSVEELAALTAGLGAAVTYVFRYVTRLLDRVIPEKAK